MLRRLHVRGFKSLGDVDLDFPRLTVLFGPNASGKSNLVEAVEALSRIGSSRTLNDALSDPIRGHPAEAFTFPGGGLPALLAEDARAFTLEADLDAGKERYRYRIGVAIRPATGALSVTDEYLAQLSSKGDVKGEPSIEAVEGKLRVRRKSHPGRPRYEPLGANYAQLSDPRLGGPEYRAIERCRAELSGWRMHYLDPRGAMRSPRPPAEVSDVGLLGEDVAPFLYRLRAEESKRFEALRRTVRAIIPSVQDVGVDLDERRGTLDITIRQDGTSFSSRIVSEGTLRVVALCAMAVNPWRGSLLGFEEPENGVHPRRLELIAKLLSSLAAQGDTQVVVTTHSPLFCDAVLRETETDPDSAALYNVQRRDGSTRVTRFEPHGPLFDAREVEHALATGAEDGLFESLVLRGFLDE